VPGSYQFSVAIQRPPQSDLFREDFAPEEVAQRFLEIVDASREANSVLLEGIVPDKQYRRTFQKLARNLAPTGKAFETLVLRSTSVSRSISLGAEDRSAINSGLRASAPVQTHSTESQESLIGVLRAVHLDQDWLEVIVEGNSVRIDGLEDTADDTVGPMVNRQVTVHAIRGRGNKLRFQDIELVE
jgi:hypothetical protein